MQYANNYTVTKFLSLLGNYAADMDIIRKF